MLSGEPDTETKCCLIASNWSGHTCRSVKPAPPLLWSWRLTSLRAANVPDCLFAHELIQAVFFWVSISPEKFVTLSVKHYLLTDKVKLIIMPPIFSSSSNIPKHNSRLGCPKYMGAPKWDKRQYIMERKPGYWWSAKYDYWKNRVTNWDRCC